MVGYDSSPNGFLWENTIDSANQGKTTGWWLSLPLWKMMDFVSWDDEIPNWMGKMEKTRSNHQPENPLTYYATMPPLTTGHGFLAG